MPSTDDIDFGWDPNADAQSCGYIAPKLLELIPDAPALRIADIGCGNGSLVGQLMARGHAVIGIENDPKGLAFARSAHPGGRFYGFGVESDPAKLLATEAPFDKVVSTEVIEHLFSPHRLIQYAHAILKPGGEMILTTPYHGYLKNVAIAVLGKWDVHHTPLWHGGHIKFWSRASLTSLIESNGFTVTGFHGVGRAPLLWKSMILTARKNA